jgi:hypothetical protein
MCLTSFKCMSYIYIYIYIYIYKHDIVIPRSSACPADGKGALQYGIRVLQIQLKECYRMVSEPKF